MTKPGNNPYADKPELEEYKDRIFELKADIDVVKGEMGSKIQKIMTEIKDVYAEAKNNGINTKALREIVKKLDHLAKADACGEGLEDDDHVHFEQQQHALGMLADLPLGQAAMAAAATERADKGNLDKVGRGKKASSADPSLN